MRNFLDPTSYRALVTYANEDTGEIRVKIPALIGDQSEVTISYVGRTPYNNVWVVPQVGSQIVVTFDDHNLSNVFWLQSDSYVSKRAHRNYFEAYSDQSITSAPYDYVNDRGVATAFTYNNVVFDEGITLVDNSKITFEYEGTYNLQYSVQWTNIDTKNHHSVVWIGYNGAPYPDSATYTSVPSSHGGSAGTAVTSINFVGKAFAGDYVQLYWAVNSPVVTYTNITPGFIAKMPTTVPEAPSIIVTVDQIA